LEGAPVNSLSVVEDADVPIAPCSWMFYRVFVLSITTRVVIDIQLT